MATVGHDFEPYRAAPRGAGHLGPPRAPAGRPVHRAGLHHHRPRRQPDHRLPPGRDVVRAPEPHRRRAGGVTLGIVSPDGRAGHDRARARLRRGRHPLRLRSRARACRCSPATSCWSMMAGAARAHGQRLRGAHRRAEDRQGRRRTSPRHVEAVIVTRGGEGSTVYTGGQRIDVPAVKPGGGGRSHRMRRRVPRRAALRDGARLGLAQVRRGSPRSWARSRSRTAAARTTGRRERRSPRRFRESAFGEAL